MAFFVGKGARVHAQLRFGSSARSCAYVTTTSHDITPTHLPSPDDAWRSRFLAGLLGSLTAKLLGEAAIGELPGVEHFPSAPHFGAPTNACMLPSTTPCSDQATPVDHLRVRLLMHTGRTGCSTTAQPSGTRRSRTCWTGTYCGGSSDSTPAPSTTSRGPLEQPWTVSWLTS